MACVSKQAYKWNIIRHLLEWYSCVNNRINYSTVEEKQQTAGELEENPSNLFQSSWTVRFAVYRGRKKKKRPTWKHLIHMFSIAEVMGKVGSGWETGDITVTMTNVTSRVSAKCQRFDCLSNCRGATNQKLKSTTLHQQRSRPSLSKSFWGSFSKEIHGGEQTCYPWTIHKTKKNLSNLNVTLLFLAASHERLSDDQ